MRAGHDQGPGLDLEKDTRRKRNDTWMLMMSQVRQIRYICTFFMKMEIKRACLGLRQLNKATTLLLEAI
jgi:hypothetical protein